MWCSGNIPSFQVGVTGSIPVIRSEPSCSYSLFHNSSAVELSTVNRLVPGSNPGCGVADRTNIQLWSRTVSATWAINSAVECAPYKCEVTGSNPVSPIS